MVVSYLKQLFNKATFTSIAVLILDLLSGVQAQANSLDPFVASNLVQQVIITGDLYNLGVGFGFDGMPLDLVATIDDTSFTINLSGVYLDEDYSVIYSGDTSSYPSNGEITWSASGFYGNFTVDSSGSAVFDDSLMTLPLQQTDTVINWTNDRNISLASGQTVDKASSSVVIPVVTNMTFYRFGQVTGTTTVTNTTSGVNTSFVPQISSLTVTNSQTNTITIESSTYTNSVDKKEISTVTGNSVIDCNSPCQGEFGVKIIIPEPSFNLSLLAFGTLGVASILKRKLKSTKSTNRETEKVS